MTFPPRSVAEALLIPYDAGTRRIWLRPIFGRIQHVHQHGGEFFLASFNLS